MISEKRLVIIDWHFAVIFKLKQVRALEMKQVRLEKIFAVERKALWDIIFQQNQLIATIQKKSKNQNKRLLNLLFLKIKCRTM